MSDFGTMISRIKREVHKDTTEIEAAIKDAIVDSIEKKYKYYRFPWNQREFTFNTVNGTMEYAFPTLDVDANTIEINEVDWLKIQNNNKWYPLLERFHKYIDDSMYDATAHKGVPTDYSIRNYKIRLLPVPNGVYAVRGFCLADINTVTTASLTTATNDWFTRGEELIRNNALSILYSTYFHDRENASVAATNTMLAFNSLMLYRDSFVPSTPEGWF